MRENRLSEKVIGCAIEVHRQLGPGLLESIYEESLCHELSLQGIGYQRQRLVPITYKTQTLATPLRLDLLIENTLILEIKAKENVHPIDKQQLLTYLRLSNMHLGLLINFNVTKLVDGLSRVVNQLPERSHESETILSGPPFL